MKRALLALAVASCAPVVLAAQSGSEYRFVFREMETGTDSAYVVPAGGTFTATIQQYAGYIGLASYTLRVWYDPAVVSFVGARSSCPDSVTYPLNTPVTGANYVDLSAAGCASNGYGYFNVATMQFQLAVSATAGTGLYLEPRQLTDGNALDRTMDGQGDFDEVCRGVGVWGDVSDDGAVNSRDALIALSNAVGLPTTGFSATLFRGDVDKDGFVGSRDALEMLTVSIGYPVDTYYFRTLKGIATACTPQPVLPRSLYFMRQGAYNVPGLPGLFGLVVRPGLDTLQTIVGDSADAYPNYISRPRVSPNGSQVAFGCVWDTPPYGRYWHICRSDASGGALVNLSGNVYSSDQAPDWSPASDSIVFVRDSYIWVMAADGSNPHMIAASPYVQGSVAWDPTPGSRRIAYIAYTGYYEVHTRELDSASTDSLVFTGYNYASYPRSVDWSPAGDSLVFGLNVNGAYGFLATARAGGAPARVIRLAGTSSPDATPAWTDQGILFNLYRSYPGPVRQRLFLLRPNGTVAAIGRDATGNFFAGMDKQ